MIYPSLILTEYYQGFIYSNLNYGMICYLGTFQTITNSYLSFSEKNILFISLEQTDLLFFIICKIEASH